MPTPVRRVITGHNNKGKSIIVSDEVIAQGSPNCLIPEGDPHLCLTDVWISDQVPADISGPEDTATEALQLHPPKGGVVFRIFELPPESLRNYGGMKAYFSQMKAAENLAETARHPGFHKTQTIDYIVVIEGEVWALVDEEEVLLKPGDCLVQRGTNHAWSNRGDKPARMVAVLVDAEDSAI